jgi:hypothetical protein
MGISSSSSTTSLSSPSELELHPEQLYDKVDKIASTYIMTMDPKTLKLLNEKEYCDKLLTLISSIFSDKLSDLEIKYMFQRIQYGNHPHEALLEEYKKEKTYYHVDESDEANIKMEKFDVTLSNDHVLESRVKYVLCMKIAKFYIVVAHLFASIMKTINPIYTYVDDNNQIVEVNFIEKEKVPPNKEIKLTYLNFCSERVQHLDKIKSSASPSLCKLNISDMNENEPTVYAFENLYFDDENYDYSVGHFTKKSDELQQQLREDLRTFYTAYTGNREMPDNITKFSDIRLKDFNTVCADEMTYTLDSNDNLFFRYAKNLTDMMSATSKHQQQLLDEIHIIFKDNIIHPDLTEENVYKMVRNARKKIIKMYTDCEHFYMQGIQMNNDIVEHLKQRQLETQSSFLREKINSVIEKTKRTFSKEK